MKEPTDLDLAIIDRRALGLVGFGPLTKEEAESEAAYERYMAEEMAEFEAQQAAGGRTVCPKCGERSVTHRSVCTLGYPGHPGAEFSDLAECEVCDYKEL